MKLGTTLILLLLSYSVFAQVKPVNAELLDKKSILADVFVGYDKFDHHYFIKDNVLYKVKNDESLEYKNLPLGKISKVDLFNPLKVTVFYERFNTLITLDHQLNETLKIDFSELKVPLVVTKIGIASQNQFWIFDEITSQIYLYDTGNGTLKSVGTPLSEPIIYYNSDFNTFEWLDAKNNWYQCSLFGAVKKLEFNFTFDTILFSNADVIIYSAKNTVFFYDRKTTVISTLENIEKSFVSMSFKNQILSIFTNREISNYKITRP